jgi:hypothetical protein
MNFEGLVQAWNIYNILEAKYMNFEGLVQA